MEKETFQPLLAVEAEAFCQSIQLFDLKDIGCAGWISQHERLEKLNMQAIINASAQENEFVKEYLINESKYPVLISDLITTEVWHDRIFSEMVKMNYQPKITFPIYMVLYHEATLINLLETTLYYQEACEACGDAVVDLIDYCYRKLVHLLKMSSSQPVREEPRDDSNLKELLNQDASLQFDISTKTLSILRYICDHLSAIPLSCSSRILNVHDFPVLLVEILQNNPFSRQLDSKLQKYIENKWVTVSDIDRFKLTKVEGQIWLTLYKLLMDPECQRRYEFNSLRKNTLLKLRSHLNEIMLDQLPALGGLLTYLEHLSMMDPPAAKQELILQQVPEIRDDILHKHKGNWEKITKYQIKNFFDPSREDLQKQAKRWADTYSFDILENLIQEPPKCALCGEQATKRCSRCQNEWYCRRECQVKAWKKHKPTCDLLAESVQKLEAHSISSEIKSCG